MHLHCGPTPHCREALDLLGPWDRLRAHLGTLLLIKVIIQLNVLLLASSFVLSILSSTEKPSRCEDGHPESWQLWGMTLL